MPLWFHSNSKKFGKQGYSGTYEFVGKGEKRQRFLVLTGTKTARRVELESHEEARADGWYQAEEWGKKSEAERERKKKISTRPDGVKVDPET